jgi:two-component system NtrC family sensor kinase
MNRSRTFSGRDGTPLLGLAKAIYNEPACATASCHVHPAHNKILGIIDLVVTLQPMHETLNSYGKRFILLTLGLLILIAGALTIFTQKLVNRPVQQLLQQTYLVAAGQLDSSVNLVVDDELGELAGAFNRMTRSLQQARIELEDWNRTLEARVMDRTEEISRMQAQLLRSEKLASLGELVAGIAHEINNPLTGILMFTSLVHDHPRLEPELRADLETVIHETERCAKIVRGLLDFSRSSVPEKCWSNLNSILRRAIALVENMTFFHDVRIERSYMPNLPDLLIDPGQVEQVFVNIILNAGQAMDGSGTLTVTTGLTSDGTWIYAQISDTGCGITPEHVGKIFDPFFTTKEHAGTGLGLSVSYGIIENHGGSIEVHSEEGRGTTFIVELPLIQEKPFPAEELHLDLNGKR